MAVSANISFSVASSETKNGVTIGNSLWSGVVDGAISLGNGTTANNADLVYFAERTVASGANDDIDVAGSLTSPVGTSFVAAKIVAIAIVNKGATAVNTTNLSIGGSTSGIPGYTTAVSTLGPGGIYLVADPDAGGLATVTASTGDILRITNSAGASATYKIAIIARSV